MEQLLERIDKYQKDYRFHPLTCPIDSNHAWMQGVEINGKIKLQCPTCGHVQNKIPNFVQNFNPGKNNYGVFL